MRDILSSMVFSNFSIFESYRAWIRRIIKACFHPIAVHDVISVFSYPVAEQLSDQNLIFAILRIDSQN